MPWRKTLPYSIAIQTAPDTCYVIVPRGTGLPFQWYVTTSEDGQTALEMKLLKGESPRSIENELLVTMHIEEITAGPRGDQRVEITCDVDRDGDLILHAKEYPSGRHLQSYTRTEPLTD